MISAGVPLYGALVVRASTLGQSSVHPHATGAGVGYKETLQAQMDDGESILYPRSLAAS